MPDDVRFARDAPHPLSRATPAAIMRFTQRAHPHRQGSPGRRHATQPRRSSRAAATSARSAPASYDFLPLGLRVLRKVEAIVRHEMDRAGAQEILMPALLPAEYFKETGRWDLYGDVLFRLKDRKGGDYHLGPDARGDRDRHRARARSKSYRDLPEEPLPGPGEVPRRAAAPRRPPARPRVPHEGRLLVRRRRGGREGELRDDAHRPTCRIFDRMGLNYRMVAGRLRRHRRVDERGVPGAGRLGRGRHRRVRHAATTRRTSRSRRWAPRRRRRSRRAAHALRAREGPHARPRDDRGRLDVPRRPPRAMLKSLVYVGGRRDRAWRSSAGTTR